jgi:stage III sporulation protein AH
MKTQTTALCEVQKPNKFKAIVLKLGKRNIAIASAVLLIGVAVFVNWAVLSSRGDDGFDYSTGAGMQETDPSEDVNAPSDTEVSDDAYFSSIEVSRQRTRDEAIEVLQAVVDNQSATETAKNEALAEINNLAKVMEQESNIETLVMAKGFENCVAVISGEKANIVVSCDELLPSAISQINEIVYDQAGIIPVNINITER